MLGKELYHLPKSQDLSNVKFLLSSVSQNPGSLGEVQLGLLSACLQGHLQEVLGWHCHRAGAAGSKTELLVKKAEPHGLS